MFTMRFDMRSATTEHYAAALDMAVWAEAHGAAAVVVCEHHASPDGYLPAPMALASAIAARTSTVAIQVAALLVPLHDPIELAETMAVLDLISAGRVSYVCGVGYRDAEFAMFGCDPAQRGKRLERSIEVMRQAWTGEPFEYDGRPCQVTPKPVTPGGPMLFLGGGTAVAVRRAVRLGIGMLTERNNGLAELYAHECEAAGVEPQIFFEVPADAVTSAFVASDPDAYWERIGPYVLHDAQAYQRWNTEAGKPLPASVIEARTIDDIRIPTSPYRVFTPDEAVVEIRHHGFLNLQPLCGGIPPALAWESLTLIAEEVVPAL